MQQPTTPDTTTVRRLNPLALAVGFGVAGLLSMILFGTVMGAMWGMMGGAGQGSGYGATPWMRGGYGGSMMSGGPGSFFFALIWGFFGSAIAGAVIAWGYNAVAARNA